METLFFFWNLLYSGNRQEHRTIQICKSLNLFGEIIKFSVCEAEVYSPHILSAPKYLDT